MRRILFTAFLVTVLGLPGLGAFACLVTGSCGCHEAEASEDADTTEASSNDKKPCCPKARAAAEAKKQREDAAKDESRMGLQAEHHECCCSMEAPSDVLQAQNEFRVQVDSAQDFSAPAPPTEQPWHITFGDAPAHRHFVPATGPPPQQHRQIHVLNCVWRA